ncbi:Copper chaperone, partial [Dysosmobacter welbionis]
MDVDELAGVLEQPLGGGGEVGVAGAHADDHVRLLGNIVGGGAAGDAQAAQVQGVGPLDGALAGLGFAEGDAGGLCEGPELLVGLR